MLARLEAKKLLQLEGIKSCLIGTIHDSIVADCTSKDVTRVGSILLKSVERVPALCKQVWGYDFSIPLSAECSFGDNKNELMDFIIEDDMFVVIKNKVNLGKYHTAEEAYKVYKSS